MKTLDGWLTHSKDDARWIKHMFIDFGNPVGTLLVSIFRQR